MHSGFIEFFAERQQLPAAAEKHGMSVRTKTLMQLNSELRRAAKALQLQIQYV